MSVQDKLEHILKEIHILFSRSESIGEDKTRIVVEKQKVFDLLEQLNRAVYEVMDEYEATSQKQELSERRSQKRGEEMIGRASKHADDIYAASIMYTDDALSRIQHIMEEANKSVQRIFRSMDKEMTAEKEKIRQNQFELKEQLRDFADTEKYLKAIKENDRKREEEFQEKAERFQGKKIRNEGKSYSILSPEAAADNLSGLTGKAFADSLRRRAAAGALPKEEEGETKTAAAPEIKVNLDSAYFKQKQSENKERRFPFSKK